MRNRFTDSEAILRVISKKWWIVPLTMLLGLTLMFLQESDLQTSPRYFSLTKTYEPLDEAGPLSIVGLDPSLIKPFPSEENQLSILLNNESQKEILAKIKGEVEVSVTRSEPNFSLTSSQGAEGKNQFSFVSYGSSSYSFACVENDPLNCDAAIDAFVAKLVSIRAEATKSGLQNSITLIDSLLKSPNNISTTTNEKLSLQRSALNKSIELVTGAVKLIGISQYSGGAEVTSVNKSTYLFGLLIGLVLGCLILLQLIFSDGKIRGAKQLVNLVGYKQFLGELSAKNQSISLQHLAAAIQAAHTIKKSTILRLVAIGDDANSEQTKKSLVKILSCKIISAGQVKSLDAKSLAPAADSPVILLAKKHRSESSELQNAWTVVEKSGNNILGVILVG
ncbi:MAG: hypothetical protein NT119_01965 [Actinobacteria bacterium]|nr:hypothetical protein [Actinomycetota bacterium]